MPTIGWFEILIIVAVAIIVVGPKDFPKMLKKIGSWMGTIKRYVSNVQQEVSQLDEFDVNEENNINQNKKSNKQNESKKD